MHGVILSTIFSLLAPPPAEGPVEISGASLPEEPIDTSKQDDLREELAKTKVEKEDAEERAEDAEDELSQVRSGKLIRWGVTGGVGPAFHVPLHRPSDQIAPSIPSGISYIMFHPAYWMPSYYGPEQNLYCANRHTEDELTAQKLADSSARKRTEYIMELLLDVASDPSAKSPFLSEDDKDTLEQLERLDAALGVVAAISANSETTLSDAKSSRTCGNSRRCKNQKIRDTKDIEKASADARDIYGEISLSAPPTGSVGAEIISNVDLTKSVDTVRVAISDIRRKWAIGAYRALEGVTPEQFALAKRIAAAIRAKETQVCDGNGVNCQSVDDAKEHLLRLLRLDIVNWDHGIRPYCLPHQWGFWFGYPLPFKVTVPVESTNGMQSRAEVNVKKSAAFGVGYSPNAYVSILTGVTAGTVNLSPADNDREVVFTWMIGFGGNLDIFTLLGGK